MSDFDLELSLDDIIKKKNHGKVGPFRSNALNARKMVSPIKRPTDPNVKSAKAPNAGVSGFNKPGMKQRAGVVNRGQAVGDARLKIIQKQRLKVSDAREKLVEIAKQTDARFRLEKLRGRRNLPVMGRPARNTIGDHILQRTIQGRHGGDFGIWDMEDEEMSYRQRSLADQVKADFYPGRMVGDQPVLYRTVENDVPPSRALDMFPWGRRGESPIVDTPLNIPRRMEQLLHEYPLSSNGRQGWEQERENPPIVITKVVRPTETVGILKRSASSRYEREALRAGRDSPPVEMRPSKGKPKTLSERFCHDDSAAAKISQIKARLEATAAGKAARPGPRDSSAAGHRIVVSNLVASVTQEDVKELFEDIGELLSSKLVRAGTAEVVYKSHADAVRAVDVYHNRQLDAQPMKCLLVNNRTAMPHARPEMSKLERKTSKGLVELDMSALCKALHNKSSS